MAGTEPRTTLADLLGPQCVVPLVVVDDVDDALRLADVLARNGLPVIEIALRTDAALPAAEAVRAKVPGAVVGIGTVRTPVDLVQAVAAGAAFAVSPGSTSELLGAARACSVPFVPGIATASELMHVTDEGFREVKCFPAAAMGGPAGIAALGGIAPDVRTMPTGGVDAGSAPAYLQVPGVFAVAGSWVCPRELIRDGAWDEIGARALAASRIERHRRP